MKTLLAGAVVLAALAVAASARPASTAAATSLCAADEAVVYSCSFDRKFASVCGAPGRLAYRFGPLGKPEIAIASAPDWSNVHIGRVTGGGGGSQTHLRFTADGHDYLVHKGVQGSLTSDPGRRWSGLVVQQGERELASLGCRRATGAESLETARDFAPAAVRQAIDDTDPRFDGWF